MGVTGREKQGRGSRAVRALGIGLTLAAFGTGAVSAAGLRREATNPFTTTTQPAFTRADDTRSLVTNEYHTVRLDRAMLERFLRTVPNEVGFGASLATSVLLLPVPDGSFQRFGVMESPIMAPELAARFPEIRTYRGQGIDDPTATLRFDLTPFGFHAQILSASGTVYVDPLERGNVADYISFNKRDYRREMAPFACAFDAAGLEGSAAPGKAAPGHEPILAAPHGTQLRTYRLAIAATGEYTAAFGGTVPGALAAITTTVNRVNGVYTRELSVQFTLIANEAAIIYTDGATDPYTNGNAAIDQNQTNLDAVIGTANYDIGHVFTTSSGLAGLGVICSGTDKARGTTGSSAPMGDAFDVDYVAHEMGHQFGGSHTFNGSTSNCAGNREPSAAFEPGSASTIQGYAGICGAENLQAQSDDYFHSFSLDQMIEHITGSGGVCAVTTATGNTPPTVGAGATYTIPKGTPFELTATGGDANGDALTFCWEERDLGTIAPPNTDDGSRPIFRSFAPTTSVSRTFPKLSDILGNTTSFGESLPTTTRTMTYRVVARDNRSGGGGSSSADTTVNVNAGAGPFLVTAPVAGATLTGGTTTTVTWDVANTNAAPVSAASVDIYLSIDGGLTFPTLMGSVPNNGSASLTVPCMPTTTGRIKVRGAGNIFFDISHGNFTIPPGSCTPPTPINRYRLYHDVTKEHLYTTDLNEYNVLGGVGWVQEGVSHRVLNGPGTYLGVSTIPNYRLYHPGIRQHHWTTDTNERNVLSAPGGGWTYEGIDGYLLAGPATGSVPLYRLAYLLLPLHVWTIDLNEYTVLPTFGWLQEGTVGHVLP